MGASASLVSRDGDVVSNQLSVPVGSRISQGCELLVADASARTAFLKFINTRDWLKELHEEKTPRVQLSSCDSAGLLNLYIPPAGVALFDFEIGFAAYSRTSPDNLQNFVKTSDSSITMLLVSAFPKFLKSKEYESWVLSQTSSAAQSSSEEVDRIVRLGQLFRVDSTPAIDQKLVSNEMIVEALGAIDIQDLNRVMQTGTWLESLAVMVEDLPIPVTLSTARDTSTGFPLVYVNKAFEAMSGYNRSEVVGQNCRFLQSSATEPEQVQLLSEALRQAKSTKVALTNVRKDGSEFGNLLALKPVFDIDGNYAYVIGVQCDISSAEVSHQTIQTMEDLLAILPNILD